MTPAQVGVAERLAEREDEKGDGRGARATAGCEELRGPGVPDEVLKEPKKNRNGARARTSGQQNFVGRGTRLK